MVYAMATRKIAVEFDGEVVVARALARAIYAVVGAIDAEDALVTVDGFSMNQKDGWTGDYRITVERRN
jgi:hypothetical protein